MKVYIAEKPNLGRAIAGVLAEKDPVKSQSRTHIEGTHWAVCWAAGHILELEEPDYYIKKKHPEAVAGSNGKIPWNLAHLPILPTDNEWTLKVSKERADLLKTVKEQVKRATIIVHAGDPDRAGQAIVDNILSRLKVTMPVRRVLVNSLVPADVRTLLADERDNADFKPLGDSETCRSRADWLYGMNFSRAVTIKAQEQGYRSAVSIGRVQTAVLSLVVNRDLEIENFKPVDYFDLIGEFTLGTGAGSFTGKWLPQEGTAGLDADGRLLDQMVARQLQAKVKNQPGVIESYSNEKKNENAPMPFSMAQIQILASKKYGYAPDVVLKTVQTLYDKYKAVTYPRVDTGYLPTSLLASAKMVLGSVSSTLGLSQAVLQNLDHTRKSRAFNDSKVTAHHGIVPTGVVSGFSSWSQEEKDLFKEISLRYCAQFMPAREYRAVKAIVAVAGERFSATGSMTISPGWRLLYGQEDIKKDSDEGVDLPLMKQGDSLRCDGLIIQSKKTQPPKAFTDDTLLSAMIFVHKYVSNPQIKNIFMKLQKEADTLEEAGLGTPATRESFVPKLINVGLLQKSGSGKAKNITSTPPGRALIAALPGSLGSPDITALWEITLKDIAEGKSSVSDFMAAQSRYIAKTLEEIKASNISLPAAPVKSTTTKRTAKSGGRAPAGQQVQQGAQVCPECGKPMATRKGRNGDFLGCTGYPSCKHTAQLG